MNDYDILVNLDACTITVRFHCADGTTDVLYEYVVDGVVAEIRARAQDAVRDHRERAR